MNIKFIALLLFCIEILFAGDIIIGIQNGVGQSYELGKLDAISSWGYRGNIYSDFIINKNIIIEPLFSYSQKGSVLKIYNSYFSPSGEIIDDKSNFTKTPSRSQIVSLALGIKPIYEFSKINVFVLAAPRVDYLFKRTIDNTSFGGNIEDITSVTTKWIPGINMDLGFDYKFKSFLVGLVFNNEFDLNYTKADFGETFRSYKYSIMLNVGYILKTNKN